MIRLTMREWTMLTIIVRYIDANGYAPTCREIATAMGKQPGYAITYTLRKLRSKGVIAYGNNHARALAVQNIQVMVMP